MNDKQCFRKYRQHCEIFMNPNRMSHPPWRFGTGTTIAISMKAATTTVSGVAELLRRWIQNGEDAGSDSGFGSNLPWGQFYVLTALTSTAV